jgi:hypothetical protein
MVSRGLSGIAPALLASVLDPGLDHRPPGRRDLAGHGHMGRILKGKLMISSTMAELPETAW